jgi:hypothetical protein
VAVRGSALFVALVHGGSVDLTPLGLPATVNAPGSVVVQLQLAP